MRLKAFLALTGISLKNHNNYIRRRVYPFATLYPRGRWSDFCVRHAVVARLGRQLHERNFVALREAFAMASRVSSSDIAGAAFGSPIIAFITYPDDAGGRIRVLLNPRSTLDLSEAGNMGVFVNLTLFAREFLKDAERLGVELKQREAA